MDAYQQSQGYARPALPPPLPSMADPQHLQQHHQLPPPPPPPLRQPFPQQPPWYSGQYQYQPPPSASSASPPPPPPPHQHQQPPSQQQQWAPPPYSDQYAPPPAYPPPHHNQVLPYPPQQHIHNQYPPPPRPHMLPPPPPPHQSYPQVNQDWSSQNWAHHQGWEYPVHSNEEDWATRARAWAAAKAAMDYQHPPPQSTPFTRAEEQTQYHDQHSQAFDPHYPQTQQQTHPTSSYPQFQSAPAHLLPVGHLQESEYVPDGNSSYTARDETLAGKSNAVLPHRESLPTSPNFHQQEVPSSYSSVTGKGEAGNQADLGYRSSQEGQHHAMSSGHAVGRSDFMGLPFSFRNQSTDHPTDPSNLPLDFVPRFNRVHEPHMHSSFPQPDTAGRMHSSTPVHAWAPPVAPGVVYPPIPPHDPSVAVSSPTPLLGRIPGPGFQPTIPSVSAPFALGAGSALHSTTAFPGDAYGVSGLSDRPKKAAVPNWLREEIIKKKAVIASSAQEHTNEDTLSIEDEGVEKSLGKGDQADSKSVDSSRSTEEEDDDEDYVEAAKTAAINQEIKRILTEVLLKVTDELFDEIATKVLSEDDPMVKVDRDTVASNHKASPSPPANPTAKASAKLLIPVRSKEFKTGDASEKSSSSSPGDVLGLGNYASDEDDDDENQTSSMRNSKENTIHLQSSREKHSEDIHDAGENGSSQPEIEEHDKDRINLDNVSNKSSLATVVSGVAGDVINVGGERLDDINDSELKYKVGEKVVRKPELPGKDVNAKNLMPDSSQGRETVTNLDKNGRYETKKSSPGKDSVKEVESGKIREDGNKAGENPVKQDERHVRKEKAEDRNGSKERKKDEGAKPEERTKESVSKKKSIRLEVEEDRKEKERGKRASAREDNGKKRERVKDEKDDRSKHKPQSDTSKHKRRRSPSSRGRNSKENSVVSHANDTSDEASEDSRRKLHSKRRNLSPSPVKSRRRQLSRSPHSKHSQRRHSPYSSLETTRKRRSRSRSPIRRQR